jgi:leucyl/phenylalanyl-tRNA--protein transferase
MPPPFFLTPEILLRAYRAGIFPMAESADDPELFWVDPRHRGILPLDGFHLSHRLRRVVRQNRFEIRVDSDFTGTMAGCAEATDKRPNTWISGEIVRLYTGLFERGAAHSVETWLGPEMVGGLYGVSIGGAFFGESMFSRVVDASKVALVHLVALLRVGGFGLLDVQFVTPHLTQFGAIEVPRARYHRLLADALLYRCVFPRGGGGARRLAAEQGHVVNRVLKLRDRRVRREHPAAEQALGLLACRSFVDLDERGVVWRVFGRARLAVAHQDRQRAEIDRRADRRLDLRDPRGDLVEPLQQRDRLGDHRRGRGRGGARRSQRGRRRQRPVHLR